MSSSCLFQSTTMLSPSLACDLSIGSKLADFLPASAVNLALAVSFMASVHPAWNNYFPTGQISPFTIAMSAIGDLFSSTKPKYILPQVPPTPTIKGPPTPTLQYQTESASSMLYPVVLCAVLVLVGAVFTVFRNNTANLSCLSNAPFAIDSASETCNNGSNGADGDIPEDFEAESSKLSRYCSSFSC